MDLFIGLFCLFIFVFFVSVLAISFLLRHISILKWQLEATSGARDHALRGWQRAAEELGATSGALSAAKPGGMAPTTLFGAIPVGGRSRWYQFRLGIDTRVCFGIDTSVFFIPRYRIYWIKLTPPRLQ